MAWVDGGLTNDELKAASKLQFKEMIDPHRISAKSADRGKNRMQRAQSDDVSRHADLSSNQSDTQPR